MGLASNLLSLWFHGVCSTARRVILPPGTPTRPPTQEGRPPEAKEPQGGTESSSPREDETDTVPLVSLEVRPPTESEGEGSEPEIPRLASTPALASAEAPKETTGTKKRPRRNQVVPDDAREEGPYRPDTELGGGPEGYLGDEEGPRRAWPSDRPAEGLASPLLRPDVQ